MDADGLALLLIGSLQGLQLLIALFGEKVDTEPATTLLADMIEGLRWQKSPAHPMELGVPSD